MGGQVFALISQYLVIAGVLLGLIIIMRKPEVLSQTINALSNANVGAITAFKK